LFEERDCWISDKDDGSLQTWKDEIRRDVEIDCWIIGYDAKTDCWILDKDDEIDCWEDDEMESDVIIGPDWEDWSKGVFEETIIFLKESQ